MGRGQSIKGCLTGSTPEPLISWVSVPSAQDQGVSVVTQMKAGSRPLILSEIERGYRVRSPIDEREGWLSKTHVKGTVFQDTETHELCTPRRP